MKGLQTRLALLLVLVVALSLMVGNRLFAAGEQLPRAAIFSGGGTISSGGTTLRSVIGGSLAGGVVSGGVGLCSGFGCDYQGSSDDSGNDGGDDDDSDDDGSNNGSQGKLFLPRVQDTAP